MMTEKEKCKAGELYDAELLAERLRCKEACHDYTQLRRQSVPRVAQNRVIF